MIYYRRYIGAYQKRTTRLSMRDHGAYALMLDFYYAEELPLPLELDDIYDLCKVRTPDDRKSVDKVLRLHFEKRTDGYHNERADHEISVSVQARKNGKGGGRPRTESITGDETGPETGSETGSETGLQTEDETERLTGEGGGSVHPSTFNHSAFQPSAFQPPTDQPFTHQPSAVKKQKALSGMEPDPEPLEPKKLNGHKAEAREILDFLNAKTGRHYEPVEANLKPIAARLAEGSTPDDVRSVIAKKCRDWGADEKMAEFLRPKTLFNATNFANYKGELKP